MGTSFMRHVYVHAKADYLIADFIFFDKAATAWGMDTLVFNAQINEWKGHFSRLVKKGKRWKLITRHTNFGSTMILKLNPEAYTANYPEYRNEQLRTQHLEKYIKDHPENPSAVQVYKNKSAAYELETQAANLSVKEFRDLFEKFMAELQS